MPPSKLPKRQVAFRFPEELLTRIARYQAKLAADMPGMDVTQANAVRVLLEKALTVEGFQAPERRGRTSRDQR